MKEKKRKEKKREEKRREEKRREEKRREEKRREEKRREEKRREEKKRKEKKRKEKKRVRHSCSGIVYGERVRQTLPPLGIAHFWRVHAQDTNKKAQCSCRSQHGSQRRA